MIYLNENIEALKILINISKNLHRSKKSNYSRIRNNKLFNEKGKDKLINQVINPLDLALLEIGNEISHFLETIPIYNIFLRHVNGINLYDSAELICEIKDIKKFQTSNNLLAYAGIYPNAHNYNKNLHKMLLRISHKLVRYNAVYEFIYSNAYKKYSLLNTNEEHIEAMARRIVIKKFLQNLFTHWIKLEDDNVD